MAHTTSTSRKPKRSTASSVKDATLGKRVIPDPRVRVHSSKATRDPDRDDSDNAGSSNSSSSTLNSSSTLVDSSNAGPSAPSRKPNWKRVTLKRSVPHSMLVRSCGPGKVIMPSVPFAFKFSPGKIEPNIFHYSRRSKPKPNPDGKDDDDATDEEPESETSLPQPSSAASTAPAAAATSALPSSTTTGTSSTALPSTVTPTSSSVVSLTTTNATILPSATSSSTTPPETSQSSLVAPVIQPPRETGLDIETTWASGTTFNDGSPLDRHLSCPSGINSDTAAYNLAPTMPPVFPSDLINGFADATPMSYNGPTAATQKLATHSSTTLNSNFVEHRDSCVGRSFQSAASSTGSNSQAHDPQPFAPMIHPVSYSGATNESIDATFMSDIGVAAATPSSITLNSDFVEQHFQPASGPVEFISQAQDPYHTSEPQSQCSNEISLHHGGQHFLDANARLLMDVDEEMGEPEPSNSHTSAPATVWQQPPYEAPHPQFNAFDTCQQAPPPFLAPQPRQFIQSQYCHSGNEAQNHGFSFSQNHDQTTSLNQYGTFPQHQAWTQNGYGDNRMSAYLNDGGMPPANYQPPAVELQWQPQTQLSSSLPSLHTPTAMYSEAAQAHPPAFYPRASYPLPTHQELLPQLQPVNPDRSYSLQTASSSSRSYLLPKRKSTPPPQIKTSLPPEDATEWKKRIAEVYKPRPINPFAPFHQGRPMLIPKNGESEPRLYCPLPTRSGMFTSTGRRPPVGSEEDLIARLALERKYQAEEERRTVRREKRKKSRNEELPVKKQKVRNESTVSRKESAPHRALPIVPRAPVRAAKPVTRSRSCPSVSKLVKALLRW